mgnify:CR=1 FL=1|jgi:ribosome-associated heat shock protein Hsp15
MSNTCATAPEDSMRLDKWLWCARFYKSRSLAADAIKGGKIRVNGDRPKPAKMIGIGDQIVIRKGAFRHEITILQLPRNRLSADKAVGLYEESADSHATREQLKQQLKSEAAMFPQTHGRPTKRDRRDLIKFRKGRTSQE